jgi:hypothetical protein
MLHNGLEGISIALLTELDLVTDKGHVLQTEVRKNLLSTKIHGYWDMYDGPPLMAYYGRNTTDWHSGISYMQGSQTIRQDCRRQYCASQERQ